MGKIACRKRHINKERLHCLKISQENIGIGAHSPKSSAAWVSIPNKAISLKPESFAEIKNSTLFLHLQNKGRHPREGSTTEGHPKTTVILFQQELFTKVLRC